MNATPIRYREEVLKPFFKHIQSGESFYIIGAPSAGKTRLMDFLMGDEPDILQEDSKPDPERVKKHYLGNEIAAKIWLARVDMNRLRAENDWGFGFFELLLNTLLLACHKSEPTETTERLREDIAALDSDVIESRDALKALRLFEMVVNMLCRSYDIRLCFLFDEFDEPYQDMPRELFAHLRAVRDANKYRVSYALFLRNLPEKLRNPVENESFYELISRNMIGLGPYSQQDTLHIVENLEKRRDYTLPPNKREWLCVNSGGHPGLMQALLTIFQDHPSVTISPENANWFAGQETVKEEFRKLWTGLLDDERDGLRQFAQGSHITVSQATGRLLKTKGLIKLTPSGMEFFSPLFKPWILGPGAHIAI